MNRKDEVAAVVFVGALDPETTEAMKEELLSKAKKAEERPNPTTRLGLALIAFTTPGIEMPSADELMEARERVVSLWTKHERRRGMG